MKNRSSIFLLGVALGLAPSIGFAADAPRKETKFGSGKAAGPYLTKEELRVCLNRQKLMTQQDGAMLKEQAELTAAKADIVRLGDDLKAKLESLDRTSPDAVAAYNDQAQARDKQIDEFQVRADAFNARVEANKAEREGFGKGCDNRRYFEDDETAIKKGR